MKRIIKLIISFFYFYFKQCSRKILGLFGIKFPPQLTILYYHSIYEDELQTFIKQVVLLEKYTKIINLKNYPKLNDGKFYSAITFDDGFTILLQTALPILEKKNIPAIIFIPTGFFGKKPEWEFKGYEQDQKQNVMNEVQIQKLNSNLFSIGSHTVSHPRLTSLLIEDIILELKSSKNELENILKKEISDISFPYGDYNEIIVNKAFELGYKNLFTISPMHNHLNPDRNILGRISITPSDWELEFKLKIRGGYNWMQHLTKV